MGPEARTGTLFRWHDDSSSRVAVTAELSVPALVLDPGVVNTGQSGFTGADFYTALDEMEEELLSPQTITFPSDEEEEADLSDDQVEDKVLSALWDNPDDAVYDRKR